MPDVRDRLLGQGLEPRGDTPEEFAVFVDSELKKWAGVVQASGVRLD